MQNLPDSHLLMHSMCFLVLPKRSLSSGKMSRQPDAKQRNAVAGRMQVLGLLECANIGVSVIESKASPTVTKQMLSSPYSS